MWSPVLGQTLLVKREPTNNKDKNAVAVYLEDVVVGHVPHNIAPRFSQFLLRDVGYGLKVPRVYRLYGPKVYPKNE